METSASPQSFVPTLLSLLLLWLLGTPADEAGVDIEPNG